MDIMPKGKLHITETILRDAHQSHAATRMKLSDMLPMCEALDEVGYWSIECWGGATFDACLRFLDEDPWERLRLLKKAMPKTPLQMLLRGQNLLGYRHYADDVVRSFCGRAISNGISVVRVFDALNDIRNMECAINAVNEYGGIAEGTISYTTSPVHNDDYFVSMARSLEQMGAKVICLKDMANLLLPDSCYRLITRLKSEINIPIHLHTHDTSGTGAMVYYAAAMAGVDIIDTALSPFATGTSQPATESIVASFMDTARDTGISLNKLAPIADHFKTIADIMLDEGLIDPKVLRVDPNTFAYQVPGGMLSNLMSQLKNLNLEDKLIDVLREVPIVRKDFGYPPLVTPTSQIVGAQAVLNVMSNERYKLVSKESKMLLKGEYGKLPGEVSKESIEKIIGQEEVIKVRPADLIYDEMDSLRNSNMNYSEEELLALALFPEPAREFYDKRKNNNVRKIEVFVNEMV